MAPSNLRSLTALVLAGLLGACVASPGPSSSEGVSPDASANASATATAVPTPASSAPAPSASAEPTFTVTTYSVQPGSHPHDVAPAADGGVWYTAQNLGLLGWLDPETGDVRGIPLGRGSSPHGVVVDGDGDAWVTDSGLNAIVRVDAATDEVTKFPLPAGPNVNLNTAAFDASGVLWFTGQAGFYGRLDPETEGVEVFEAPRGRGPYGIAATPDGEIWFVSLAGRYLADVDEASGEVREIDPPTSSGLRRVWADSSGRLWVSEWEAGQVAVYDPATEEWREWRLPGDGPQAYSVFVDEADAIWLTDFGANAIVRFDPQSETFMSFPADHPAEVRQMLGRPGEVWGAESAADQLVVVRAD